MHSGFSAVLVSAAFVAGVAGSGKAQATDLIPKHQYKFQPEGILLNKEKAEKPEGVSGIACMPPAAAGVRRCLAINDERRKAQFIEIDNARIRPGEDVELIGKEASDDTLGRRPKATCPEGAGDFDNLDGEGASYSEPYFYVVGSHGCSRKGGEFKLSAFILARVRVDAEGKPLGKAETTYRLSDVLKLESPVNPYFGKALMKKDGDAAEPNGLNIEGIAVVANQVFVGLRAPFDKQGDSFLVKARVDDLFARQSGAEQAPSTQAVSEIVPLPLGANTGIRDLATLPDGRLLILAGPAQTQPEPYSLFILDPSDKSSLKKLGVLKTSSGANEDAKAEAVTLLGPDRVLILFDSVLNGGPREYALPSALY